MKKSDLNNEELLVLLPDFIAGRIEDKELTKRIENKISSSSEFREEYESLARTYSEIIDMKFSEPPEHYFTNLLPRINKRLEQESGAKRSFRLSYIFRYAIPAVSVVLVILIITLSDKNGNNDMLQKHHDSVPVNINENLNTEIDKSTDAGQEVLTVGTENTQTKDEKQVQNTVKNLTQKVNVQSNENTGNLVELLSYTDEQEETDDDYFYDPDFTELTQNEQAEILNKLENINFK